MVTMKAILIRYIGEKKLKREQQQIGDDERLSFGFLFGFSLRDDTKDDEAMDALIYAVEALWFNADDLIFCKIDSYHSFLCAWDTGNETAAIENFRTPTKRMFDYHVKRNNEKRKWYRIAVNNNNGKRHLIRCNKKGKPKKKLPEHFAL